MLLDLILWYGMLLILLILAFVVIMKGFSKTERRSHYPKEHHTIRSTRLNDDFNNDR